MSFTFQSGCLFYNAEVEKSDLHYNLKISSYLIIMENSPSNKIITTYKTCQSFFKLSSL